MGDLLWHRAYSQKYLTFYSLSLSIYIFLFFVIIYFPKEWQRSSYSYHVLDNFHFFLKLFLFSMTYCGGILSFPFQGMVGIIILNPINRGEFTCFFRTLFIFSIIYCAFVKAFSFDLYMFLVPLGTTIEMGGRRLRNDRC